MNKNSLNNRVNIKKEFLHRFLPFLNIFLVFCIFFIFIIPKGFTDTFTFQWSKNGPGDNVVSHNIYWRAVSGLYTDSQPISILPGVNPGQYKEDPSDPSKWIIEDIDIPIVDPTADHYFVITAVDNEGYESSYSNVTGTAKSVISNINPAAGPLNGGIQVTITGTDLFYGAEVYFDASKAENIQFVSETQIICNTPASQNLNPNTVKVYVDNSYFLGGAIGDGTSVSGSFDYINFGIVSYSFPLDVVQGSKLEFSATGGSPSQYLWTFSSGTPINEIGSVVTWVAPNFLPASPKTVTVTLQDQSNPIFVDTGTIRVYSPETILDKPATPPLVQAGSYLDFQVTGGSNSYTWTVKGPEGYLVEVDPSSNSHHPEFRFTAPSFSSPGYSEVAGEYIIEVADDQTLTPSDKTTVLVPMKIDPNHYTFLSTDNPMDIVVRGVPAGTTFSNVELYNLSNQIVTGDPGYGSFGSASGIFPDQIFTYTIDLLQNRNQILTFTALFEAAPPAWQGNPSQEVIKQIESGTFRIIPVMDFPINVQDINGNAIDGATVSVITPALPQGFTNQISDCIGGNCFITLPNTGDVYTFAVSKANHIATTGKSSDFANGITLVLTPVALSAQNLVVSGRVSESSNPLKSAVVTIYYEDANGEFELAGNIDTFGNFVPAQTITATDGTYRVNFNESPSPVPTRYLITAYVPGYYGAMITSSTMLPVSIDIASDPTTNSQSTMPVNVEQGGAYEIKDVNTQKIIAGIVLPPGSLATSSTDVTINIEAIDNIEQSYRTAKSGNKVYSFMIDDGATIIKDFLKPITITIPFDLNGYKAGAFFNGSYITCHAEDYSNLIDGIEVSVISQIINADVIVDSLGNRVLGTVTFPASSLSVFGIGTPLPVKNSESLASANIAGGGGGCFIATAAFGSKMERHVKILSDFRDRFLLTHTIGVKFVDFYYKYSPGVANYLRKHPSIKAAVRLVLIPISVTASLALNISPVIWGVELVFLLAIVVVLSIKWHRWCNHMT